MKRRDEDDGRDERGRLIFPAPGGAWGMLDKAQREAERHPERPSLIVCANPNMTSMLVRLANKLGIGVTRVEHDTVRVLPTKP